MGRSAHSCGEAARRASGARTLLAAYNLSVITELSATPIPLSSMHTRTEAREPATPDQTLLVLLAQAGDRAALEQVLRDTYAPLRRYITHLVGAALADDILQETGSPCARCGGRPSLHLALRRNRGRQHRHCGQGDRPRIGPPAASRNTLILAVAAQMSSALECAACRPANTSSSTRSRTIQSRSYASSMAAAISTRSSICSRRARHAH